MIVEINFKRTNMVGLFTWLLFLHWVGDFVCQTRWIADNKSKNYEALFLHVFIYGAILWLGLIVKFPITDVCRFVIINFIAHFIVDWITSKATRCALETKNMHLFFAILGFDQFAHACTLLISCNKLLEI